MLRLRSALTALAAVAVLGTAACDLSTGTDVVDVEPTDLVYAPALNVDFSQMQLTPEGVYYQILTPGTGEAIAVGDEIRVNYRGWFPNGNLFDQNTSAAGAIFHLRTPTQTQDGVIAGWVSGLNGAKVGETRKLVIRPSLGYGSSGLGSIPPNAVLVFNVTVLEKLPDDDGS